MIRRVLRTAVVGLAVATFICGVPRGADAQVTTITIKSRDAVRKRAGLRYASGRMKRSLAWPSARSTRATPGTRSSRTSTWPLALPNGKVAYRTTFTLRKPVDMTKGAGVVFYNVVNRGRHQGPGDLPV